MFVTEKYKKSNSIKSLKTLETIFFIKMYEYKNENKNSVMNRILDPINILDIIDMVIIFMENKYKSRRQFLNYVKNFFLSTFLSQFFFVKNLK